MASVPVWQRSNLCGFSCVEFQDEASEDGVDLAHAAHSNLAVFQTQCAQKTFKKAKQILKAMRGVVEGFEMAGLKKLRRDWAGKLSNFTSVVKTSSNTDGIAYAYFNFSSGSGKTPKQVSELAKEARRCGEAMKGGAGSESDSSKISDSSPEKRRRKKRVRQCFRCGGNHFQSECDLAPRLMGPRRMFQARVTQPVQAPRNPSDRSCFTCRQFGHMSRDCPNSGKPMVKKEA